MGTAYSGTEQSFRFRFRFTVDTMSFLRCGYFSLALLVLLAHRTLQAPPTPVDNDVIDATRTTVDDTEVAVQISPRNESAVAEAKGCTPEYGISYFARNGHGSGSKEWGYKTYKSFNEGWTACARLCKEDRECLAWTLDTKYHHCHLRNARHKYITEIWYCLSGTHDCYTSAEC